jgi:tyrosyl-tRNA synthetase
MSLRDELIVKYFELATEVSQEKVGEVEKRLKKGENPRDVKAELAHEIVKEYYSEKEAKIAGEEFNKVFKEKGRPDDIQSFNYISGHKIIDVLVGSKLVGSKSDVRRLISQKGIRVNDGILSDINKEIEKGDTIQVGKRRWLKIS